MPQTRIARSSCTCFSLHSDLFFPLLSLSWCRSTVCTFRAWVTSDSAKLIIYSFRDLQLFVPLTERLHGAGGRFGKTTDRHYEAPTGCRRRPGGDEWGAASRAVLNSIDLILRGQRLWNWPLLVFTLRLTVTLSSNKKMIIFFTPFYNSERLSYAHCGRDSERRRRHEASPWSRR